MKRHDIPFLRDAALYTIATMLTPALGFILLPVFTSQLTSAEYGIMTTVQALVGILQLFMVLSLHGAVTRLYYDYKNHSQDRKRYLGTIVLFVILFSVFLSIVLMLSQPIISPVIFSSIPARPFYYYLVILSLLSALNSLPATILRVKERAVVYTAIHVIKSAVTLLLTLYLLFNTSLGPSSYLLAMAGSGIVTFVIFIWSIRKDISASWSWHYIKISLLFSLPLLPHVLSNWIITTSDRVILEKFISLEELGVFALAVQGAMVLRMVYMSVNSAFVPKYNDLLSSSKDAEARKLTHMFLILMIGCGVFSLALGQLFLSWVTTPDFEGASQYLWALIGAEMIFGLNYLLTARIAYQKMTGRLSISSSTAAILNIGFNFIFIPMVGIWGAIIATYIAEFARSVLNIWWAEKLQRDERRVGRG
ncbi:lipopolysaccharide biosynthesis protein [Halobacillus halophilus]|uniref:lipopolysaccharide biosynthesis protein n=1 Tax=Halobacillus halophilus TaxID=1570 RepID=UPI001CD37BDF|nr:oligosaccharide flippase family protein [Halobacillus halophilus]MCA1012704.1 oligosaccharide flippase family protein [Halobacillus halophilus]